MTVLGSTKAFATSAVMKTFTGGDIVTMGMATMPSVVQSRRARKVGLAGGRGGARDSGVHGTDRSVAGGRATVERKVSSRKTSALARSRRRSPPKARQISASAGGRPFLRHFVDFDQHAAVKLRGLRGERHPQAPAVEANFSRARGLAARHLSRPAP